MKRTTLLLGLAVLGLSTAVTCNPSFTQPGLTYRSYRLLELPGAFTKLRVNVDVQNRDDRDGDIKKVVYRATVEGVVSEEMTYDTRFTLKAGATANMDMPVTFTTTGAVALLEKLQNGANLNYTVAGKFYASTSFGDFELNLAAGGSAVVECDIDDYFVQPEVQVEKIYYDGPTSPYTGNPLSPLVSEMKFKAVVNLTNQAAYGATFKSARYTITLEGGLTSNEQTYASEFAIAATGASGSLVRRDDMPATFAVNTSNAASFVTLAGKIGQQVQFTARGTMTLTADLGAGPVEFVLPLATSGQTLLTASL
jgi:hypothetical protein